MKKSLITILLMTGFFCYSQTIDHAQLEVLYDMEWVWDRLEPKRKNTDEMILLIGGKYTGYYSYMNYIRDSLRRVNPTDYAHGIMSSDGRAITPRAGESFEDLRARAGIPDGQMATAVPARVQLPSNPFNKAHFFINRGSAEVQYMNYVVFFSSHTEGYFTYTEILEKPIWKISVDTDQVAGYRCQKASSRYGGRDWTVWFTHEIPISEGPWKLRGLPGLILKAETADGEFALTANSVSRSSNRPITKDEKNVYQSMPKRTVYRLIKEGNTTMAAINRPLDFNLIEILE
ncbi:MAG: GLPGLI family protein [Bacteroidales bacterium]|jgi:GLPGLI family protein|nr:GLPGLI family protein [Bacteroidales bacterium]